MDFPCSVILYDCQLSTSTTQPERTSISVLTGQLMGSVRVLRYSNSCPGIDRGAAMVAVGLRQDSERVSTLRFSVLKMGVRIVYRSEGSF